MYTHARTHARTPARPHARARTHTNTGEQADASTRALTFANFCQVMSETEVNSKLVRACVERTDQAVLAKAETDRNVEALRSDLGIQSQTSSSSGFALLRSGR